MGRQTEKWAISRPKIGSAAEARIGADLQSSSHRSTVLRPRTSRRSECPATSSNAASRKAWPSR